MSITKTKNMGNIDRIVRTALGSLILLKGLITHKKFETRLGAAFVICGLTGYDPLLKLFGTSTIIGAKDNLMHKFKQSVPEKSINQRFVVQTKPKNNIKAINTEIIFEHAIRIE